MYNTWNSTSWFVNISKYKFSFFFSNGDRNEENSVESNCKIWNLPKQINEAVGFLYELFGPVYCYVLSEFLHCHFSYFRLISQCICFVWAYLPLSCLHRVTRRRCITFTDSEYTYHQLLVSFYIIYWNMIFLSCFWCIWFIRRGHRDFEHHFAWS
jgi:hypothetical protein